MAQRLSLFAILCFACQAVLTVTATANDDETFFESQIRPALAEHCIKCHGPAKQSGGLRLDSADGILRGGDSGSAIVNGDAKSSLLIQAIGYEGDVQMPPKGKLPAATINALTHWVQAGAKWPQQAAMIKSTGKDAAADHWAFQPVVRPLIPDIAPSTGQVENVFLQNPIDHFVAKRLIDAGLSHSSEADRRTQIRRLAFSLTGLPPTPDEVTAFVNDTEPDAYKTLVDRLLDSPAHGEHWARHWLDVARYSDTKGYVYAREERFWVHAWAYRDWIVTAFNSDMPF
ncbi:MAG: DUF1549 domain-containing protein, partial [Planctomycetota bacterium]|nr:DUF1549 domain-containing protein [Planctomycetota bacterium]